MLDIVGRTSTSFDAQSGITPVALGEFVMRSLIDLANPNAEDFVPHLDAQAAAVEGTPTSLASYSTATTHLPAESLDRFCIDSKQAFTERAFCCRA
jgi:hypothetical protein